MRGPDINFELFKRWKATAESVPDDYVGQMNEWMRGEDIERRILKRSFEPHTCVLKDFPQDMKEAFLDASINDCYAVNSEEACKLFMSQPQNFPKQKERICRVLRDLHLNPNANEHGGVKVRGRYKHWGLLWGYVCFDGLGEEVEEMYMASAGRHYNDAHESLVQGLYYWPPVKAARLLLAAMRHWELHGNVTGGGTGLERSFEQLMERFVRDALPVWEHRLWMEFPHSWSDNAGLRQRAQDVWQRRQRAYALLGCRRRKEGLLGLVPVSLVEQMAWHVLFDVSNEEREARPLDISSHPHMSFLELPKDKVPSDRVVLIPLDPEEEREVDTNYVGKVLCIQEKGRQVHVDFFKRTRACRVFQSASFILITSGMVNSMGPGQILQLPLHETTSVRCVENTTCVGISFVEKTAQGKEVQKIKLP